MKLDVKILMKSFLLCYVWFSGPFAWSQTSSLYTIQKAPISLNSEQELKLNQFFLQVSTDLPEKIRSAFPEKINVQFKKIGHLHGQASLKKGITLSDQILKVILSDELQNLPSQNPNGQLRSHKTQIQEARGTLIHETAHLYDFLNVRSIDEKSFIQNCQFLKSSNEPNQPLPDMCEVYLDTKTTLSTDPYYLEIAGWPLSVQGTNYREPHNIYRHRTADELEFKNSVEHFAVNFEYYLLDPQFSCRKPILARFFDQHFDLKKSGNLNCQHNFYVDPSSSNPDLLIRKIPMERVYQIHYLHAGKGSEAMSLWGHAMFRVVICDPKRAQIGPDCMKDEFYHVVLSFRAFINSFSISSWKGLTGAYPSRLFIVPFEEVKKNYLQQELRDLTSYPLHLSESEKERFLMRALESHWSYDNRYYFITNNCASESLNLLKSSLLRPELLEQKVIKPTDLRDLLLKLNISKSKDFSQETQVNIEKGLYFESHGRHYIMALAHLTGASENLNSVKKHLELPFRERIKKYSFDEKNVSLKTYAALSILETASLNQSKSKMNDSIVSMALNSASQIKDSYQLSIDLFNLFSAPHEFISPETYGLPLNEDISEAFQKIKKSWELNLQNSQSRRKLVESFYTQAQINEITQTENYLDRLLSQLKVD